MMKDHDQLFIIHRAEHKKNYTVISNDILKNKDLSLRAKGFLILLLSLASNWKCTVTGFSVITGESAYMIRSLIRELEETGHLRRLKLLPDKSSTGRIQYIYEVYEEPQHTEKQYTEYQQTGSQHTDDSSQSNINSKIPNDVIINNPSNDHNMETPCRNRVRAQVRTNIDHDLLVEEIKELDPYDITVEELDEIVELLVSAICSTGMGRSISGEFIPQEEVARVLLRTDYDCICRALRIMQQQTDISNVPAYLLSVIFNGARSKEMIRGQEQRSNDLAVGQEFREMYDE